MATSKYHSLLEPSHIRALVQSWLHEDVPSMDYGGCVVGNKIETATLYAKSPGVLAGVPFFNAVFEVLELEVSWHDGIDDGFIFDDGVRFPIAIATITGPVRKILMGERVALNTLSRCSGIATRSHDLSTIAKQCRWKGKVAATRKTTPGFRLVEKYGVLVGGCDTHRMDLSSMIMLKDNHVWSTGSITQSVKDARSVGGFSLKIEVECRDIQEAMEACEAGADVVMLDNMDPEPFAEVCKEIKLKHPRVLVEGSGKLNEKTLALYCNEYADILSLSIMQNYSCVDFSLKVNRKK
eukprot:CAMPEP_0184698988 /NCGR_PEP_ID=MMETSP0313-20130426/5409_1 /TAXON_ID=2792 /ORGANISM="Porphyridium aerugineum, Strain SAG 1380-2" /LENGTH=294 /DNA_ID=CAMNT_0027157999 /DNA_START=111 /DNA_END=995 /DNA_ORIENTATION=+